MISLSEGIAVDAAHSKKNRKTEFRGVDLKTGKVIFYKDLGNQTINIGEFLAIVEAVKYIIEYDYQPKVIFSDSTTAISWFKNKRTASGKRNPKLMKAEIYLRAIVHWIDDIEVVKWDNARFGEIPADFNRKH
ncbi:MAG: reverse transcriptase-like protein [Muribaculum sp.]|nr:reverse transcriptase-like protein [Muribaculum sp.]